MIKLMNEIDVEGKFFKHQDYEMRSEDGCDELQCSISYDYGKTKKGIFARCHFGEYLKDDYDYAYFMLLNTLPKDVYTTILDLSTKDKNYETIVTAASKIGFVLKPGKGANCSMIKAS